jgi:hypothetical protein
LCAHLATKRTLIQVVDERALTVDLDHRQPLAMTCFEDGIAPDVDLLQLEAELALQRNELLPCSFTQVTARGPVEDDPRYG